MKRKLSIVLVMIKQTKLLIIIKCFTGDIMTFLNALQIYFALCFNLNIFYLLLNIINPLFSYQNLIYKSGQINSQRKAAIYRPFINNSFFFSWNLCMFEIRVYRVCNIEFRIMYFRTARIF